MKNLARRIVEPPVQALADFLVRDCCVLCKQPHPRCAPGPACGLERLLGQPVEIRYLGFLSLYNKPVCARCLSDFEIARESGRLGTQWTGARVETQPGEWFGPHRLASSDPDHGRPIRVFAPFMTNDAVLQLVHLLKFNGYRQIIGLLAGCVVDAWLRFDTSRAETLLVPTPMRRRDRRRRGFNQATLLAEEIARIAGIPVQQKALQKSSPTKRQASLSNDARADNVRGAFNFTGPLDADRVLLVDDLVTTGATAGACCAELLAAGARSVDVLSFARAI